MIRTGGSRMDAEKAKRRWVYTFIAGFIGIVILFSSFGAVSAASAPSDTMSSPSAQTGEHVLTAVRFTGVTVFDDAALAAVVADDLGAVLSFEQLDTLAERITAHYREHGYSVARAYLPVQTVDDGVVQVSVVEGRYGDIVIDNGSDLQERVARRILSPLVSGEVIHEPSLDRALLLLNDLPGVAVTSTLAAANDPGRFDLHGRLNPTARWGGRVAVDNGGNPITGPWRGRIAADINHVFGSRGHSPRGLGDRLSVSASLSTGAQDGSLLNGKVSYEIPVGATPVTVGASIGTVRYALGEHMASLDASGTATHVDVSIRYPLRRAAGRILQLTGAFGQQTLSDTILSDTTDKHVHSMTVGFNDDRTYSSNARLRYGLQMEYGRLNIHTPSARADDALTAKSHGPFTKLTGNASYRWQPTARTAVDVAVRGQATRDNLDSSAKFSLGGKDGVRAFAPGAASGDAGWLVNANVAFTPEWFDNLPGLWRVTTFIDAGGTKKHAQPWSGADTGGHFLSGVGVGMAWANAAHVSAALQYACKVAEDPAPTGGDDGCRLWFEAGIAF